MNKKIVITGTGRAGTSALMHLFTELGFKTGFTIEECEAYYNRPEKAGLEKGFDELVNNNNIDIFKKPEASMFITKYKDYIKHLIVPIRDNEEVAISREKNQTHRNANGGFWKAENREQQILTNYKVFYTLCRDAALWGIPITFLHFPAFIYNPSYLFLNLYDALDFGELHNDEYITYTKFFDAHKKVFKPEMITTEEPI